ncbi:hypothetical protein KC338_g161 [Hortaea werneckii]|nr:hypothetical protein KC338_g161 [Hortaea werneckii]
MTTGQPVEDAAAAVAKAGIPKVEEWKKMAAEYKNTSIPLGSVSSSQQVQGLQQGVDRMSLGTQQANGYGGHSRQASHHSFHQQQQQNLYAPVRASVPRYIYADDKFHFIVECKLSNNTHWDLQRVYEDFYELQINLINAFPEEAGQVQSKPRILPYMPGPVQFVTDGITEGRRSNLDEYLRDLLQLPTKITCSSLVRNFFAPRGNDYEIDPNAVDLEGHARPADSQGRHSQASQGSYAQNAGYSAPGHARQPSNQPQHGYSQSQASNAPTFGLPATSASSRATTSSDSPDDHRLQWLRFSSSQGQSVVRQRHIVERRRLEYKGQDQNDEDLDIEYRDEKDGEYYRLEGDEDLEIAVERNEKLTLATYRVSQDVDLAEYTEKMELPTLGHGVQSFYRSIIACHDQMTSTLYCGALDTGGG